MHVQIKEQNKSQPATPIYLNRRFPHLWMILKVLLVLVGTTASARAAEKPNILIIFTFLH